MYDSHTEVENRAYSNTINLTTALHAGRRVVLKEHYGWAFNG